MRIVVIGGDQLVYFLGKQFASKGYQLTLIAPDREQALSLSRRLKATVLVGDGSDPRLLESAEAYRANVLLALTERDQDNLIACQIAQDRYGVPRTIALVNDPENREIFEKLGVTIAFSATEVLGSLIGQQTDFQDIKNLLPVMDGEVNITEVVLQENSPAVGRAIRDLDLRGAVVACVIRRGHVIVPKQRSYLHAGDRLLLVSEGDRYGAAQQALVGRD
ncbi:MAG: TrkA family potassium uptake protein [Leptolyngbya sp. SIO4C1]|nr:TrkA family potassium uptake protein [Leptolyngbya sp. SIO4C1]